jgi:predicted RNA-binding Zn-ribbon protein involved in translation (DUF1610 family)
MRNESVSFRPGLAGFSRRNDGGSPPIRLTILTVIVLAMAVVTVYDTVFGRNLYDRNKQIPFLCVSCGNIQKITIGELQKMQKPGSGGPMMGPMVLPCAKCGKQALTQAVACPKCGEIFILQFNPAGGKFDDRCPKCHESFAKAWQEKYRGTEGE